MLTQDVQRRDLRLAEDQRRREFDYGKMTTLLVVEGERVSGTRQMYTSQLQADAQRDAARAQMWGAVAGGVGAMMGGPLGGAVASNMFNYNPS